MANKSAFIPTATSPRALFGVGGPMTSRITRVVGRQQTGMLSDRMVGVAIGFAVLASALGLWQLVG